MSKAPDPKILQEIQQRLEKGENLWRIIDQYGLTMDQRLEVLRLFDDQKWD
ncbi:hypothetical protein MJD09_10415 [bacterium]|nr:hypothetical protein [bacterium]